MTIKASTGLRNAILDTGSLRNTLANGVLMIFAGTVPTTADDALGSAVLLCTVSLNSTGSGINFASSASAGAIAKAAETWSGVNGNTGTASFFRHVLTSDTGVSSTSQPRLQGTAGTSGTDLILASGTLTATQTTAIDSYSITLPTG